MMKLIIWILITLIAVPAIGLLGILLFAGFYLSPQDELTKADAIVAISGGETDQRVDEAVALYHAGWAPILIFSGAAKTGSISNALAMKRRAETKGVPASDIRIEELSVNTKENARNVGELVQQESIQQIILVTSPYHQKRASLTFGQILGPEVTVINHSSKDSLWRKNGWWETSDSRTLTFSELGKIIYLKATGESSI